MAVYPYIVLSDDHPLYQTAKRFVVVQDSYRPVIEKAGSVTKTVNGKLDIAAGAVFQLRSMKIRARLVPQDTDYGTYDDLKYFFSLNNPNGSPSNILEMTDHYGEVHNVVFAPKFEPILLGVLLDGVNSSYLVDVMFHIIPE